jgi:hypothetical protein
MSITSRARDALKFPDRTEASREATAARIRIRTEDAEQAVPAAPYLGISHAGNALFHEVVDLQHVAHTLLVQSLRKGTDPITQARESRRSQLVAFRNFRVASKVRRYASPVVKEVGDVYSTLSNGQRVRNDVYALKRAAA